MLLTAGNDQVAPSGGKLPANQQSCLWMKGNKLRGRNLTQTWFPAYYATGGSRDEQAIMNQTVLFEFADSRNRRLPAGRTQFNPINAGFLEVSAEEEQLG